MRVGYREIPHELCASGKWDQVAAIYRNTRPDQATRFTNELKRFYETGPETLWITFSDGKLSWAFANGGVTSDEEGYKHRRMMNRWRSASIKGTDLDAQKLSTRLTQVTGFRGTICQVRDLDYLLRKINGEAMPAVESARDARSKLTASIVPLIERLTWKDFELLVDLVFTAAGWRRIGVLGKTEKNIDLDMSQPVTGERILVQVKSKVTVGVVRNVAESSATMEHYDRIYLVTHSTIINPPEVADDRFEIIGAGRLAVLVLDAGLTDWLLEKSE